jgi:hypothetical protein
MLATVDLDNVVSDQELAFEFVAAQATIAYAPPKLVFGQGGFVAHAARASPISRIAVPTRVSPSPYPLPQKGGEGNLTSRLGLY